jgi:hypothetical protein
MIEPKQSHFFNHKIKTYQTEKVFTKRISSNKTFFAD